ncbi:MAG TPA: hypothetical protein ENN51_05475 [candidate division WOR-3 bacterium]|uniref:DUF5723 domain-containing protein n=1 Tax=candidate division WOR-3 bacterium TaxID=2052148 RepID=A0A7V0T5U7_UNCW3|nr:hypothetical protein [candidate division WOR-3 bacterium]
MSAKSVAGLLLGAVMCAPVAAGYFNPALVQGIGSAQANPAFLAGPDRPGFACRILDAGVGFDNNSFTAGQFNRYSGAWLDDAVKTDILTSIPGAGLRLAAKGGASAVEFGWANLAAWLRTELHGRVTVPRELFELALEGNQLDRQYRVTQAEAIGFAFARAGLGVATALGANFAVGAGISYLYGLGCAELTSARAGLLTTAGEISADGRVGYRTAAGGSGWALNAGIAGWHDDWRFGLAAREIGSGITWNREVTEAAYSFDLEPGNAFAIRAERHFSHELASSPGARFVTRLPLRFELSLGRSFASWFSAGLVGGPRLRVADQPGAKTAALSPSGWDVRGVVEFLPLDWLPVSCHLGYDSETGGGVGGAIGLLLGRFFFAPRAEYRGLDPADTRDGLLFTGRGFDIGLSVSYEDRRRRAAPEELHIYYGGD